MIASIHSVASILIVVIVIIIIIVIIVIRSLDPTEYQLPLQWWSRQYVTTVMCNDLMSTLKLIRSQLSLAHSAKVKTDMPEKNKKTAGVRGVNPLGVSFM